MGRVECEDVFPLAALPSERARLTADCARRIGAGLDAKTMLRLQVAALSGAMGPQDLATYRDSQAWMAAMRRTSRAMAADPGRCGDWPEAPLGLAALILKF